MKTRKKPAQSSQDRWLVSYADFITLLFAFFVVLYASAQVDKKRVGQLSEAIQTAFDELGPFPQRGGKPRAQPSSADVTVKPRLDLIPQPDDTAKLEDDLKGALAKEIGRQEVSIYVGPEGLVLSLREAGFFDTASDRLRPEAAAALDQVARVLIRQPHSIRVEGHTDNVPIHNEHFASNWELSTARATEIVRLLITEHDFSPQRLSVAGYAEFHPATDNDSEEGRKKNRRVDIVVLRDPYP